MLFDPREMINRQMDFVDPQAIYMRSMVTTMTGTTAIKQVDKSNNDLPSLAAKLHAAVQSGSMTQEMADRVLARQEDCVGAFADHVKSTFQE